MMTKFLFTLLFIGLMSSGTVLAETLKSIQYRIENMHCGGCAGKVKKALSTEPGVKEVNFDLDKRVVTISYDADKINPDVLSSTLTKAKYAPAPYSVNDVIDRTASFKVSEMRCGGCASKVKKNISVIAGVKSVDVDLDSKSVKVAYDANKVSKAAFKGDFMKMGYTVTSYYANKAVAYDSFKVTNDKICCKVGKALAKVKGILDVNVNKKAKTIAVAYNTKVLDKSGVMNQLKAQKLILAE